jgi:hypothetical protein
MDKKKRALRPPPVLDCARVLHYVRVDKSVKYAGRTLLFVDGKELGRVPCMAICENHRVGILLFHCNRNWRVLGCSGHDSVASAKKKAEWVYPGLSKHWIASRVSKTKARRFLDRVLGRCTFCGKRPDEVERLFGKRSAQICDDCVKQFHKISSELALE